jgi:O-antigen/teichoic acid export membrane protein
VTAVQKNTIANFLGRGIAALLAIIFVPWYIEFLGAEAYGLVGFYLTFQAILSLVDAGLGSAFNREVARLSISTAKSRKIRDLSRTFEVVFLLLGVSVAALLGFMSRFIATSWVNPIQLSIDAVASAVLLMGMAIGLQLFFIVYQSGLMGIQRQARLNVLLVVIGTLRGVGGVLTLTFVASTIQAFFIWQVLISLLQVVFGHLIMWSSLPSASKQPKFALSLLYPLIRFIIGVTGTALLGVVLMQSDKLILSKLLTLEMFGYYAIASSVVAVPSLAASAIYAATYPRFSQLVMLGDSDKLAKFYHTSCQLVAVLLIPIGLIVSLYSYELILTWTGNELTAQQVAPLVSILELGQILMGLMLLPYALQLAYSWIWLGFISNVLAVCIIIPLIFWLASTYGSLGASFSWTILYGSQMLGIIYLMHRRILPGEKYKWYIDDVGKPMLVTIIVLGVIRLVFPSPIYGISLLAFLGVLVVTTICLAAVSTPDIRSLFFRNLSTWREMRFVK